MEDTSTPGKTLPESGSTPPVVALSSSHWSLSVATISGHITAFAIASGLLWFGKDDPDKWGRIAAYIAAGATIHPKYAWSTIGGALSMAVGRLIPAKDGSK